MVTKVIYATTPREDHHFIRIELEGYQPYEIVLTHKISGWVLGNLIVGGPIGLAVDAISGGLYELTPDQVQGDLRKSIATSKKSDELYIAAVMFPDPSWKKIANLVRLN